MEQKTINHFAIASLVNESTADFMKRISDEINKLGSDIQILDIRFSFAGKQPVCSVYFRGADEKGYPIKMLSLKGITKNKNQTIVDAIGKTISGAALGDDDIYSIIIDNDEDVYPELYSVSIYFDQSKS